MNCIYFNIYLFAYLFAGVIVATVQLCRHLENANVVKSTNIVDRKIEEVGLEKNIHWWCNDYRARLEHGRSGSNQRLYT
jgi:hypothetical protein